MDETTQRGYMLPGEAIERLRKAAIEVVADAAVIASLERLKKGVATQLDIGRMKPLFAVSGEELPLEYCEDLERQLPQPLPCPFCGRSNIGLIPDRLEEIGDSGVTCFSRCFFYCIDCETEGPKNNQDREEALKAWNNRKGKNYG